MKSNAPFVCFSLSTLLQTGLECYRRTLRWIRKAANIESDITKIKKEKDDGCDALMFWQVWAFPPANTSSYSSLAKQNFWLVQMWTDGLSNHFPSCVIFFNALRGLFSACLHHGPKDSGKVAHGIISFPNIKKKTQHELGKRSSPAQHDALRLPKIKV